MGRRNDALVCYMNRPAVMADFFNGCLYEGEKRILPEELAEVQRAYAENMRDRNGRFKGRKL